MRNALVRMLLLACLAGTAALALVASASAKVVHPRIFLDPGTLTKLQARAQAGTAQWVALHQRCNEFRGGTVEWPDGNAYPDREDIGAGYQGDGYLGPLLDVALCYEVTGQPAYAAKGIDVLTKMSAPSGAHAVDPLTDSGYGIRNYGIGLAIGYDWLHDQLTAAERSRIRAALVRWLSAYEQGGFERDFPQGNYYAGYYAAKAYAALATEGDTTDPELRWTAWLNGIQRGFIQPYYAANLAGGGWPEGWNYGPLGTLNMTLPSLAAKTAKGLDLPYLSGAPYAFPLTSPRYVMQFTWPDLRTLEDDGALYSGDNPSGIPSWFLPAEAGFLEAMHTGFAPAFHSFAAASRAAQGGPGTSDTDLWTDFLFWNPSAPREDYRDQPRSYYARGMEAVAARSSWQSDATWLAFKSGPYTNFPDAAHEYYDAGGLSIVNGTRPFLVNAAAELLRNRKGTGSGDAYEQAIYNDLFYADEPNRSIFNVFYVAHPTPRGQSARLRSEGARTGIDRFEDGGRYVLARGAHLEDMYPQRDNTPTIRRWIREVLFVRPHVVAVFDTTRVTGRAGDRWMAWHFGPRPSKTLDGSGGAVRYDIGKQTSYAGSVDVVGPPHRSFKTVDLFKDAPDCNPRPSACGGKTFRLEIHGSATTNPERWLTVFDSAASPSLAAKPAPLGHPSAVTGALLQGRGADQAIGSSTGDGTALRYTVRSASTRHTIIDLPPNASYRLSERRSGASDVISLRRGAGDLHASPDGVLTFTTGG